MGMIFLGDAGSDKAIHLTHTLQLVWMVCGLSALLNGKVAFERQLMAKTMIKGFVRFCEVARAFKVAFHMYAFHKADVITLVTIFHRLNNITIGAIKLVQ